MNVKHVETILSQITKISVNVFDELQFGIKSILFTFYRAVTSLAL